MLGGDGRRPLRNTLARAFRHFTMKVVAHQFATSRDPARLAPGLNSQPIQPALADVAAAFKELQQARHEADNDLNRRFTRAEVLDLINTTDQAFRNWRRVRGTIQADTFLTGLLVYNNIQG